ASNVSIEDDRFEVARSQSRSTLTQGVKDGLRPRAQAVHDRVMADGERLHRIIITYHACCSGTKHWRTACPRSSARRKRKNRVSRGGRTTGLRRDNAAGRADGPAGFPAPARTTASPGRRNRRLRRLRATTAAPPAQVPQPLSPARGPDRAPPGTAAHRAGRRPRTEGTRRRECPVASPVPG